MWDNNSLFQITEDTDHALSGMVNRQDEYQMNWVAEGRRWGKIHLPEGIIGIVTREFTEAGNLREKYSFRNATAMDFFLRKNEIGIAVPFPDNYVSADICMTERCHAHIWCGGETTYIYGLRMGGKAPHLGLVLCRGAVNRYSLERNEEASSNDRGSIILHPEISCLKPGESYIVEWELFWFEDRDAFLRRMNQFVHVIDVRIDRPIRFSQETLNMHISHLGTAKKEIGVWRNGMPVTYRTKERDGVTWIEVMYSQECPEEEEWQIRIGASHTTARTLIISPIDKLAESRCDFITGKQQCRNEGSKLLGAFLIYDNEEKKQYYSLNDDHNAGRERVAMGVLLAACLQKRKKPAWEQGLELFTKYVYRELYDDKTGIVYNDAGRNNQWHRLYNYPWMAVFFMERYKLYGKQQDLLETVQIIRSYYEQGGRKFYAIGIPVMESVKLLEKAGAVNQAAELTGLYRQHADLIAETGLSYPAHEVNYEQSIVAPAVMLLLQVYELTGTEKYLQAAEEQMEVLKLFNGRQPDYHLFETAIRHWDGYWFGKRRTLGDTFPHYWSALSGLAFKYYAQITGDRQYLDMAEASLRGVLSMIREDGSASCAYVYPTAVNGVPAGYADPWANDQDWGMYFYLKEGSFE